MHRVLARIRVGLWWRWHFCDTVNALRGSDSGPSTRGNGTTTKNQCCQSALCQIYGKQTCLRLFHTVATRWIQSHSPENQISQPRHQHHSAVPTLNYLASKVGADSTDKTIYIVFCPCPSWTRGSGQRRALLGDRHHHCLLVEIQYDGLARPLYFYAFLK